MFHILHLANWQGNQNHLIGFRKINKSLFHFPLVYTQERSLGRSMERNHVSFDETTYPQLNTTLHPPEWLNKWDTISSKCCRVCGTTGTLIHYWWNWTGTTTLETEQKHTHDPTIIQQSKFLRQMYICGPKDTYRNTRIFYRHPMHYGRKLDTT